MNKNSIFRGKHISPTHPPPLPLPSLNRHIVEIGRIYNFSFCVCLCVWSMRAIFQKLSPHETLIKGSKPQRSNHSLSLSQYSCASLVKIHPFSQEIGCKPFSNNLSPPVTLKIGSKSQKSNQFFSMSQQYSCASLVRIHPFLHEIGCRQAIFQQS